MGSEAKQRSIAKDLLGDNLVATEGVFTTKRDGGGEEIIQVPFAYVTNIIRKAADMIEHHRRYQSLTFDGYISTVITYKDSSRPHLARCHLQDRDMVTAERKQRTWKFQDEPPAV